MSSTQWVVYLIGDNGNGRVTQFMQGDDKALDGIEIPVSLLAKDVVIRIEQEVSE